jgi:transcriptional antiterminator RfaH
MNSVHADDRTEPCGEPAPAGLNRRWYAVQTKTGRETFADANLLRQGYRTFLPQSYRTIRHARKITTVRSAFFPGYLFVSLDVAQERWRSIDGTFGVVRIVKAQERPIAAPEGLVEALVAATGADGLVDRAGVLAPGATARFIGGPFADQLAVVEAMTGPERVRVLLSIMNQTVPVEARRSALAAV